MHALRTWPPELLALLVGLAGGSVFALGAAQASPLMAVAAVAGAALAVLFLREPLVALCILAAVVPMERFGRLSDDTATFEISIMRMLGMLAFVMLVVQQLVQRRPIRFSAPLLLWTAYVTFALVSLTYSTDVKGGMQIASGAFGNILFLYTISSLVRADSFDETLRRARLAIFVWLLASTAVAGYSVYDWHFGSGAGGGIPIDSVDPQAGAQLTEHRWSTVWTDTAEQGLNGLSLRRSMGPTSHAAVFGINLLMSIPFFVYAIRVTRSRLAACVMALGLAATMYCLLLTNTRSVLLIAALTVGLCLWRRLLPVRTWMIAAGIAACGVALIVVPVDIFNRILNTQNYTVQNSEAMRIRLDYWEAGFRAILDNWVMGVGVGNRFVMLSYLRNPIEGHSTMHNIYLQTALDVGLLGWLSLIAFLVSVVSCVERLRRSLGLGLGRGSEAETEAYWLAVAAEVLVITVLVFGLQVDVLFFPLKAWWLLAGIAVGLQSSLAASRRPAVRPGAADAPLHLNPSWSSR